MNVIYIICFFLLLVASFLIFKLTPSELSKSVEEIAEYETNDIKKIAERAQRQKKKGFISSFLSETYDIMKYMKATGKFIAVCILSVVMCLFGIIVVSIFNKYFIPGVVVLCIALPFLYIHQIFYRYSRSVMKELEITLSQITTSYIRTEKILDSVEENLPMINPPIKRYFQEFVAQIKYVDPNERQAIDDLSEKINDNIFKEWCGAFKRCAGNRKLKYLLNPSLDKYTTVKNLDDKIKVDLFGIKVSYWVVMALVYSNYLLLYFINKDWYDVLVSTTQGLIASGVLFFIAVVCSVLMSFMTKPVKYKL